MEPGTRWVYCGGATALRGKLISNGTGRSLHEFAREALFDPLGLGPSEWLADAKGDAFAASGLRLRPRDLTRISQLVLRGGEIDGRRIIPEAWIVRTMTQYVSCDEVRRAAGGGRRLIVPTMTCAGAESFLGCIPRLRHVFRRPQADFLTFGPPGAQAPEKSYPVRNAIPCRFR